jgi:ligand-binding sensor domain-containing protein
MVKQLVFFIILLLFCAFAFGQVQELAVANDGTIWLARDTQLFRIQNNKLSMIKGYQQNARITDLAVDGEGNIWVASDQGLLRCDLRGCEPDPRVAAGIDLEALTIDNKGTLWLSTRSAVGMLKNGSIQQVLNTFAQALAVDSSGAIWIGSGQEVIKWQAGRTKIYSLPAPAANVRMMPPITSILPAENKVYVGTHQGLLLLNGETFERVADLDVFALAKENSGGILIGVANGLKRMTNGKITNVPL